MRTERHIILPARLTPKLAYLLGVFAGDGSLAHRPSKHEYSLTCVGNPRDEQEFYREVISPLLRELFGISPVMRAYHGGTTFGFQVYSGMLVRYLVSLGLPLGKKESNLCIPSDVLAKDVLAIAFIRGVFDTDGCVCFKRKYRVRPYYPVVSWSSKSALLISQIAHVLSENGLRPVVRYHGAVRHPIRLNTHTYINTIELNGRDQFFLWKERFGTSHPKHLAKIKRWEEGSGG